MFVGFNRRFDPEYASLKTQLVGKTPLYVSVVCKDHPFPPASYLQTCGSIFRDCVVHDIDMMCYTFDTYPMSVSCSCDENGENASTTLSFLKDGVECVVRMIHSRHSPTYEQFVVLLFRQFRRVWTRKLPPPGTSFNQRYNISYKKQMFEFCEQIKSGQNCPHIDLSHSTDRTYNTVNTEESALDNKVKHLKSLRAYDAAETKVKDLYRQARQFHSYECTSRLMSKYKPGHKGPFTIWHILDLLKNFQDISDPDVDVPNDQHALQTAESIRSAGLPDWLQLVGLIHDFGKVLHMGMRWHKHGYSI